MPREDVNAILQGTLWGVQMTNTISSYAAMASSAIRQWCASLLFTATGYGNDYILLKMGEMPQRTFYTNLYLDAAMSPFVSKYPVSCGVSNIATKTIVDW